MNTAKWTNEEVKMVIEDCYYAHEINLGFQHFFMQAAPLQFHATPEQLIEMSELCMELAERWEDTQYVALASLFKDWSMGINKGLKNDNRFVKLLKIGRANSKGNAFAKNDPKAFLALIDEIANEFDGTPIDEFLQVFPLRKRYADDGMWDYHSAKAHLYENGDTFTRDSFLNALLIDAYANIKIMFIGLGFMQAVGSLHREQTGMEVIESFMIEQSMEKEKHRVSVKNRTHLTVLKGGKA